MFVSCFDFSTVEVCYQDYSFVLLNIFFIVGLLVIVSSVHNNCNLPAQKGIWAMLQLMPTTDVI